VKIRVLVADDHPVVRDGLKFSLARAGRDIEIVGEAEDGATAVALARSLAADVVVMDITMPRLNGLDATRDILRGNPAAKVIILSLHDARTFVEGAMEAGARGYLTKETACRDIAEAVAEVHAGRYYLSPSIAHILVELGLRRSAAPPRARGAAALTGQERKVLQLIAEGLTGKEIAGALAISPNTVHAHRTRLMAKLGLHKQTDLVRYAVKEGLAKS
jgi:DNA-binding NarL/FixJ family response regulator